VEDDPYRLLFLPEDPEEVREEAMPGVEGLPLSLLSLDVDGRVIHLESLSKWVCPGLRLGWLTGPKVCVCVCVCGCVCLCL
jgi:DNA-binding transcriptional MocR family regulator